MEICMELFSGTEYSERMFATPVCLTRGKEQYQVLQDPLTGNISTTDRRFLDIIAPGETEIKEQIPSGPYYGPDGILFRNDFCMFRADFVCTEKVAYALQRLCGIDLIPEECRDAFSKAADKEEEEEA